METFKKVALSISVSILILLGTWLYSKGHKQTTVDNTASKVSSEQPLNTLTDNEIKNQIDDILDVLMRIHYISIRDKEITSQENLIAVELEEAMNDVNKLKNLQYKTEVLSKSGNEIISVSGLALSIDILSLIDINNRYIDFLRKFDITNIDVPEFQYQITLFRTSSHDIYLKMAEEVSLLPMITVRFAEKEGETNSVNENIKEHFLTKIDELFGDILAKDNIFYKETKSRNVVPVIINGYKTFFTK